MTTRRTLLASAAALAAAPALAQAPTPTRPPTPLRKLLDQFAQEELDRSPETVTSLGLDKGTRAKQKSLLDDGSLAQQARERAQVELDLARLKRVGRSGLSDAETVDYDVAEYGLSRAQAFNRRFDWSGRPYVLSQLSGAYVGTPDFLDSDHVIETADDAHAYLARLNGFATELDQDNERTRHDAGVGVSAPDFALDKTLAQLRSLRDAPLDKADLVQSLVRRTKEKGIAGDWATPAAAIYRQTVLPALDRQIALVTELRKTASTDAGVWRLPDGDAFYDMQLKGATTTNLSPAETHALGLQLVADYSSKADVIFRSQGITQGTTGQRLKALFADPRFLAPNTEAGKAKLIADANGRLAGVRAKLPQYFGVLPKAPVEVRRVSPATELGASTHYSSASLDGSRPGIYWLNLRDTAEVPTWDLWTTTYHEAIPGHHMQISIAQEADIPLYRKMRGFSAYSEGWALYAEQLADEMGLYADDPFGRIGYLHDALLRAVRLVIDTGVHSKRWSRERAVAYFSDTLGDPPGMAVSEVERYCVRPGQACSYMAGKTSWLRGRDAARARLGAKFDIRRFHDAGLTAGSMPLTVLERRLARYV
ncbi:DUF885 family protein [soil metagenome]